MIKGSYGFKKWSLWLHFQHFVYFGVHRYYKGRCNIFNLSRYLVWPPHGMVMRNSGSKLLEVCHQPGKSCDHKHWDSQDIMFLICHLFKGLCEVMGGNFLRRVPTLPCLVAIGLMQVKILSILLKWPQKSMWLKDQVNWWVSAFHDVSTLPSLVVIGIAVAGRKCF